MATIALSLAFVGVASKTKLERDRLRVLSMAPRASIAEPRSGPAIYAGALFSEAPRVSPLGKKSAAYWWWVEQKSGKTWRVKCSLAIRSGLELRSERASLPLAVFPAQRELSLLADTRDDWTESLVIDVGRGGYDRATNSFPGEASKCAATGRTYTERSLPQGVDVEVLACFSDGALRGCGAPFDGLLAVPDVSVHRARRIGHAMAPVRAVGAISLVVLLALAGHAFVVRRRILHPISRGRGQR